ncbi:hypothetical protein N2152v2_000262 [Parachlorella kessleri]
MDAEAPGGPAAASPEAQGSGVESPAPQEETLENPSSRLSQAGAAQPAEPAQEQEALGENPAPGGSEDPIAQQTSQLAGSESSGRVSEGAVRAGTRLGGGRAAGMAEPEPEVVQEGLLLGDEAVEQGGTDGANSPGPDAGESEVGINIVSPAAAGRTSGKADVLHIEHSEDHLAPDNLVDLAVESSDLLEGAAQEAQQQGVSDGIAAVAVMREGAGSRAKLPPEEEKLLGAIKSLRLEDLKPKTKPRAASMVVPAVANLRQAGVSTGLTPRSVRGPLSSRTPRALGVAGSSNKAHKFSFSAPPHVPRPKTAIRHNYSHTPQRVRQILLDNEALVKRLGEITYKGSKMEEQFAKHDKAVTTMESGCAVRRAMAASKVVRENLELFKRLQAAKPSPTVSRKEHRKSFDKSRDYVANLAMMRQGSPVLAAVGGISRRSLVMPMPHDAFVADQVQE